MKRFALFHGLLKSSVAFCSAAEMPGKAFPEWVLAPSTFRPGGRGTVTRSSTYWWDCTSEALRPATPEPRIVFASTDRGEAQTSYVLLAGSSSGLRSWAVRCLRLKSH